MPDKLISAERTKQELRNYIESPSLLTLIDTVIDRVPSVDPMAKGQWMRYDLIVTTLRAEAARLYNEDVPVGGDAVTEMANYFEQLSLKIGGKT